MTATEPLAPGQSTRNHADRAAVDRGVTSPVAPAPATELHDATAECRPVFPWRPVVLVLATTDDPAGWTEVVALVDDLQDLDVDARIALPSAPSATSRWVQPARASEATVRALRPDVVLAWDEAAVAVAESWSRGLRTLTVVERTGAGGEVTTVPWRIGVARGRVRGRFGPDAVASDLAPLIRRLAAGPHAEAPDPQVVIGRPNRSWDQVDPSLGVHRRPRPRSCVYVLGAVPSEVGRSVESLAGHLRRARVEVDMAGPGTVPPGATGADLVVLHGVTGQPGVDDLVARRTGRRTVVHLAASDVDGDGRLRSGAADLIDRTGHAVAATEAGMAILRAAGAGRSWRAITVPPLMPAGRYRELALAQEERHPTPLLVIGWAPGDGAAASAVDRAVEDALTALLDEQPGARVDLVRGVDQLAGHAGVRRLRHEVRPHAALRWTLFLSSGHSRAPLHEDLPLLAEIGVLGVPSLVPAGGWPDGPGRVEVADPDLASSWTRAITAALDDGPAGERLGAAAASAGSSIHRPSASDAVVNRLLGWLDAAS